MCVESSGGVAIGTKAQGGTASAWGVRWVPPIGIESIACSRGIHRECGGQERCVCGVSAEGETVVVRACSGRPQNAAKACHPPMPLPPTHDPVRYTAAIPPCTPSYFNGVPLRSSLPCPSAPVCCAPHSAPLRPCATTCRAPTRPHAVQPLIPVPRTFAAPSLRSYQPPRRASTCSRATPQCRPAWPLLSMRQFALTTRMPPRGTPSGGAGAQLRASQQCSVKLKRVECATTQRCSTGLPTRATRGISWVRNTGARKQRRPRLVEMGGGGLEGRRGYSRGVTLPGERGHGWLSGLRTEAVDL